MESRNWDKKEREKKDFTGSQVARHSAVKSSEEETRPCKTTSFMSPAGHPAHMHSPLTQLHSQTLAVFQKKILHNNPGLILLGTEETWIFLVAHKFIHTHQITLQDRWTKITSGSTKRKWKNKKHNTPVIPSNETMSLYRASLPKRLLVTCFLENLCRGGSYTPASLSLIQLGFTELWLILTRLLDVHTWSLSLPQMDHSSHCQQSTK